MAFIGLIFFCFAVACAITAATRMGKIAMKAINRLFDKLESKL